MSVAKKTKEYKIIKRRDGRFAVENAKGQPVNGAEKVAILMAEGFLKQPEPKPVVVEEPVAEEVAAEEPAAEEGAAE